MSFYNVSRFTPLFILLIKLCYTLSLYFLSDVYTFMSSNFFLFLQISMLLQKDDKYLLKYIRMRCKAEDLIRASLVSHFLAFLYSKALFLQFIYVIFYN
jgi:hypothetical protein